MLFFCFCLLISALFSAISANITGTNPANGACLCFYYDAVNIRSSACGAVIGIVNSGQCFTYTGFKQVCSLGGISYEFFRFDWGGTTAWAAGDFMNLGSASACAASSGEGYQCSFRSIGQRCHEMTSPTPYDCVDNSCQNTCQGGQCVAYVTCSCTSSSGTYPPGTQCWRPGTKLKTSDGKCNRNVPSGTAIATFDSNGNYYAGHAAVFHSCSDDYTIRVVDQWCCRNINYSNYPSSHSYFSAYAVITNPSCADRSSWPCRWENAGSTCCPTSNSCAAHRYWWLPLMESAAESS